MAEFSGVVHVAVVPTNQRVRSSMLLRVHDKQERTQAQSMHNDCCQHTHYIYTAQVLYSGHVFPDGAPFHTQHAIWRSAQERTTQTTRLFMLHARRPRITPQPQQHRGLPSLPLDPQARGQVRHTCASPHITHGTKAAPQTAGLTAWCRSRTSCARCGLHPSTPAGGPRCTAS